MHVHRQGSLKGVLLFFARKRSPLHPFLLRQTAQQVNLAHERENKIDMDAHERYRTQVRMNIFGVCMHR